MQKQIEALHALYCQLSGFNLRFIPMHHDRFWYAWIKAGFTEDNLRTVIAWIADGIAKERWTPSRMRFSYLIERPEAFAMELAEAQAVSRNKKAPPSPRERAVESLRPTAPNHVHTRLESTARPISEVIAAMRIAAQ